MEYVERRGRLVDTRAKAKLVDEYVEETTPLGVVGFGEIKLDGDMRLDVHCLQDSC